MADPVAVVNKDQCVGCGACVGVCPNEAITLGETADVDPEKCIGCGTCASTCPTESITIEEK